MTQIRLKLPIAQLICLSLAFSIGTLRYIPPPTNAMQEDVLQMRDARPYKDRGSENGQVRISTSVRLAMANNQGGTSSTNRTAVYRFGCQNI